VQVQPIEVRNGMQREASSGKQAPFLPTLELVLKLVHEVEVDVGIILGESLVDGVRDGLGHKRVTGPPASRGGARRAGQEGAGVSE